MCIEPARDDSDLPDRLSERDRHIAQGVHSLQAALYLACPCKGYCDTCQALALLIRDAKQTLGLAKLQTAVATATPDDEP